MSTSIKLLGQLELIDLGKVDLLFNLKMWELDVKTGKGSKLHW